MRIHAVQDKLREIRKTIEKTTFWKDREAELDNLRKEIQLNSNSLVDSYLVRYPILLGERNSHYNI